MPSTTKPSGQSLHRPSSGYLVTWAYRATRLQTTCASVHFITTQWKSRRRGVPRGSYHLQRLLPPEVVGEVGHLRHRIPLQSSVSLTRKFADLNRRKEVAINRLRLRHCCLNPQLHLWGRHASGNCDGCGVPETFRHFLLECPAQVGLHDDLAQTCARSNWPFDLRATLCQPSCLDIVYK